MTTYRSLRALRDQARQIQPDQAWVKAARGTLLMQVKNAMPTEELAARERESLVSVLFGKVVEALRGPALAVTSVAAVVLGGSIASVSASEQSLPGDILYPVKLATEQARMVFTSGTADKVRLKSEFTKRRVDELKTMVTADDPKKDERVGKAADVLKSDLDTLRRQLSEVKENEEAKDTVEAARIVDKQAVEVAKTLADSGEGLSVETQEKVDAAKAQAVDVGIEALEVLVNSSAEVGETASNEDILISVNAHTEIALETVATAKATVTTSSTVSILIPSTQTSSTKPMATSTSALKVVEDAEASLQTVPSLLEGNQLQEAVNVLKDVTLKSLTVQKQASQDAAASNASSTSSTSSVLGTSTSTLPQASSSTSTSSTTPR